MELQQLQGIAAMNLLSMEEATTNKVQTLFAVTGVASFGSLHRVSESIWKELVEDYDQDNVRKNHPGCSLRKHNATLGPISMLHGTSSQSRRRSCIAVKNVYGDDHTTYFGGLDPVPIGYEQWQNRSIKPAEKMKLDGMELEALEGLCVKRGW
jgi:hypothetical protein